MPDQTPDQPPPTAQTPDQPPPTDQTPDRPPPTASTADGAQDHTAAPATPSRTPVWIAAGLGALGLAVAIAALVIAIGAKDNAVSDQELAAAVRKEALVASSAVKAELEADVKAADRARADIQRALVDARVARAKLRSEQSATNEQLATIAGQVTTLQADVDQLDNKVSGLTSRQDQLQSDVDSLITKVAALEAGG
jgi:hypothetical protein